MEFMILILFGYDSKKVLRKGEKNVKENDFFHIWFLWKIQKKIN